MLRKFYWWIIVYCIFLLSLAACNRLEQFSYLVRPTLTPTITVSVTVTPSLIPTSTQKPSFTPSPTTTSSKTPTQTLTASVTNTPTKSLTPSITSTPTLSLTPTTDFPDATINVDNAHCRYGPGKAYLHAADLYKGDHGLVWNRNYSSTWLWVRFDKLHYACWVAASLTDIEGDISSISTYSPPLPKSTLYGPPEKVITSRNGEQVVVSWEEVWMTEDDFRGYLIEARVCQNGYSIDLATHTNGNSYTFLDEKGCTGESKGRLYAVEKHGYTDYVNIPWP